MNEEIQTLDKSYYKVKRGVSGLGFFAAKDIKKGDWIIEYIGIIKKNEDVVGDTTKYLFDVNGKFTIDGSPRYNTARYINHSCKSYGNAVWKIVNDRIYIRATKNIKQGQEITFNYGKEYFDAYIKPHGCKCGACKVKK